MIYKLHKLLKDESGYSLTELVVAMVILAVAIIPMVGMFDVGLRSSTVGSNLDKARAFANERLENAKSLSFADARDKFPGTTAHAGYDGDGEYSSGDVQVPSSVGLPAGSTYTVVKQYVALTGAGATRTFSDVDGADADPAVAANERKIIRVTVTIEWDGNDYTTSGVVAE